MTPIEAMTPQATDSSEVCGVAGESSATSAWRRGGGAKTNPVGMHWVRFCDCRQQKLAVANLRGQNKLTGNTLIGSVCQNS